MRVHRLARIPAGLRRPSSVYTLLAVALSAIVVGLAACSSGSSGGTNEQAVRYLSTGSLTYVLRQWRELDLSDGSDAAYLAGVAPAARNLGPGEDWFAVFLQVYNKTASPHMAAKEFTIEDNRGNVYLPVVPSSATPLAYQQYAYSNAVRAKGQIPPLGTAAYLGQHNAVLLYKIKASSLSNRDIEINVIDPVTPGLIASTVLSGG
jgi:hypothetical protein